MKNFHILLLSAGSLLGQNILDCLENRRSKIRITGLNSESRNPRIFMCDKAYKAPLSTSDGFRDFVMEIVNREKPDLIMPGRDADVLLLAELAESSSDMRRRIPGGSLKAAKIINNKWESYRFAVKHGLKFAPSLLPDHSKPQEIIDWVRMVGLPVLVKPLQGFGSNGVRIIYEEDELNRLIEKGEDGLLLQKILGPGSNWQREVKKIKENMDSGVPLFTCLADDNQYSSEMVINPDGSLGEIMTCKNLMVMGRCEEAEIFDDPDLIRTSENFAAAIAEEGWRGMFNLQCRKTDSGFCGFEMNGRLSGSASARGWLGYDEMRDLIRAFYDLDIGTDPRYMKKKRGIIFRSHADFYTMEDDIKDLNEHGVWIKKDAD
jgi:carbamoyl-phosphate synthase large subunit